MASRSLTPVEEAYARKVFGNSINFHNVEISDGLGIGNAEYTTKGWSHWHVHLGPLGFHDAIGPGVVATFIHELTHVWQSQHATISFMFMVRSGLGQVKNIILRRGRNATYNYTLGKTWSDYNVEQQAQIVEDWYIAGSSEFAAAFRYIRDNIRAGKN